MTVLPQVLTLLLAGLSLYLAASSGVKHGSEPDVTLADRVGALERLLLHQEMERQELKETVSALTDKMASLTAEKLQARYLFLEKSYKEPRYRDVAARSDDADPLEVVVSQLAQRLTEVSADVQTLQTVDQHHVQAIQEAATSAYTRWGHSACPASNSLVYSGVIGGEWSENPGAAGNYLCLTLSPVQLGAPSSIAAWTQVYGTEYNTGDSHQDKNAVCAVCRSPRPTVVMVPGTNVCWSGWTVEYSGYLMADDPGSATKSGTEFICVDTAMQNTNFGDGRQNGAFLAYTRSYCGYSLPCSPYAHKKLVTCAVCSK